MSTYRDQDRAGSIRSGPKLTASQRNLQRKERLRLLALETADLSTDPYFLRNQYGTFECRLCRSVHKTEEHYLAHTQGRRHQGYLEKRAIREAKLKAHAPALPQAAAGPFIPHAPRRTIKIGRPGYTVVKQRDEETNQWALRFELQYPEIEEGLQPRHRMMSCYEQRKEPVDRDWQYLLFAAPPYETIAFKIPNKEIDKSEGKFFTEWNADDQQFVLQLSFK